MSGLTTKTFSESTLALSELSNNLFVEELQKQDENNDGELSFSEVKDEALPLFSSSDRFTISDEADYLTYAALVEHHKNTKEILGIKPSSFANYISYNTERWITSEQEALLQKEALYSAQSLTRLDLLDYKLKSEAKHFLFKYHDNDGKAWYFTLHLTKAFEFSSIEINGRFVFLSSLHKDENIEYWRKDVLKKLYSLFSRELDFLEEDFHQDFIEFLEGAWLKADPTFYKRYRSATAGIPPKSSQLLRQENVLRGKSPQRGDLAIASSEKSYTIPLQAEKKLSAADKKLLQDILQERLQKTADDFFSVVKEPKIEVVEDDIALTIQKNKAVWLSSDESKLFVRRSLLNKEGAPVLKTYFSENIPLMERHERFAKNLSPVRLQYTLTENIKVPVQSEKELSPEEVAILDGAFEKLPKPFVQALEAQGVLDDLKFEVVEDDIIESKSASWIAWHYKQKIHFKRSYLQSEYFDSVLIHELGHAFPFTNKKYLFDDYYQFKKADFENESMNPFVTPYALKTSGEMLSESLEAYFLPDENILWRQSYFVGPCSRDELREKNPLLYLAFQLYFQPDSPFFGNDVVFLDESSEALEHLLNSPISSKLMYDNEFPDFLVNYFQ